MNADWIAAERAKLKAEQDNAIGLANQCAGALKMLAAVEAELQKAAAPVTEPPQEPPADG